MYGDVFSIEWKKKSACTLAKLDPVLQSVLKRHLDLSVKQNQVSQMATIQHLPFRKVLLLLALFLFASVLACDFSETDSQRKHFPGSRRRLLEIEKQDQPKMKTNNLSTKNQTKILKPTTNSTKTTPAKISTLTNTQLKKLNSTSKSPNSTKFNSTSITKSSASTSKSSNSTKSNSAYSTKSSDLLKTSNPKIQTAQAMITKHSQEPKEKKPTELKSKSSDKNQFTEKKKPIELKSKSSDKNQLTEKKKTGDLKPKNSEKNQFAQKKPDNIKSKIPEKSKSTDNKFTEVKNKTPEKSQKPGQQKTQKPKTLDLMEQEEEDDLVAEFRDLPSKFHQTFLPDLERISTTSRAYLNKANKEITRGFKPLVGNKYAPIVASVISCAFILLPLLLVSLIFNRIKAYFSLQRLLIFIQMYLSIYFSILCSSALASGVEPLKFFYSTSQSTYVCLQVLQTLGYVLYLLLLLMYLVLVFSTLESGLGSKLLGLGQTFVGFAVGLHYYVNVFHRAVLHQAPKTNWKVHGIYATCFIMICLFASAERRKKVYLEGSGEEGKKS